MPLALAFVLCAGDVPAEPTSDAPRSALPCGPPVLVLRRAETEWKFWRQSAGKMRFEIVKGETKRTGRLDHPVDRAAFVDDDTLYVVGLSLDVDQLTLTVQRIDGPTGASVLVHRAVRDVLPAGCLVTPQPPPPRLVLAVSGTRVAVASIGHPADLLLVFDARRNHVAQELRWNDALSSFRPAPEVPGDFQHALADLVALDAEGNFAAAGTASSVAAKPRLRGEIAWITSDGVQDLVPTPGSWESVPDLLPSKGLLETNGGAVRYVDPISMDRHEVRVVEGRLALGALQRER